MITVALLVMDVDQESDLKGFQKEKKGGSCQQVEELKTQLHQAEQHSLSKEQRIKQLSNKLESETNESKALWDQVEYLTIEHNKERDKRKQLADLFQREKCK